MFVGYLPFVTRQKAQHQQKSALQVVEMLILVTTSASFVTAVVPSLQAAKLCCAPMDLTPTQRSMA